MNKKLEANDFQFTLESNYYPSMCYSVKVKGNPVVSKETGEHCLFKLDDDQVIGHILHGAKATIKIAVALQPNLALRVAVDTINAGIKAGVLEIKHKGH